MSELPIPGKLPWNDRLKYVIVYPSETVLTGDDEVEEYVIGVVQSIGIDGIGYTHELRNSLSVWGLGLRTKPPNARTGSIIISESDWVYTFLRWLATSDEPFDLKVVEIDEDQNPGRGQWQAGQEAYIGCKVDAYSKEYAIGEEPFASFPFSWTLMKYMTSSGGVYIGDGQFLSGNKPTLPSTS